MKRIKIVGTGLAVLGLAALPMPGTFAATSVTDTVTVNINAACDIYASSNKTGDAHSLSATVANDAAQEWAPSSSGSNKLIYIYCNDSSGWNIKAVGAQSGTATAMIGSVSGTSIPSVASGSTVPNSGSGTANSSWGFKLSAGTGVITGANGFTSDYKPIPSTATIVASSSSTASAGSFYVGYKVYVSPTQAAGTYTGKVSYTIATGTGS
ncbi:hypothetical protein IJJ36_04165 [Candidatus Saccharibacteria bacterium]|nr:hypothetical protein [Candidatus Saccharibacteria bacterium]